MATQRHYVPGMADAAVKAKTGKDWASWFTILDKAGAAGLDHKSIVHLLSSQYGVPGSWSRMVSVEYERARGRRARHESAAGYSVAVSKTLMTSLPHLYAATANLAQRRKWFPKGAFEPASQTQEKYLRGSWNKGARLEIGLYAKGAGKTQIALQIRKLAKKADVETERKAWKAAVLKLQELLEH